MLSPRIALKLFADPASIPPHAKLVEAWHGWIKSGKLSELLVDVVDYGHVHQGPSVLLVGHESDYALDYGEGKVGLLYVRKRAPDPGADKRLADSLVRVANAASILEGEPLLAGLKFQTQEIVLKVLDRLAAPNERATWDADKDEIDKVMKSVLGPGTEATYDESDPKGPFTVRVRAPQGRPLAEVLRAAREL
ncbi:MAG: hypothetical protein HOV80_11690 [Polyangiaceae bacterium]|nr:hypothetical protein [Polyangiaceae bacterium]